jgi:SAM-dependent methyltransferase
MPSSILRNRPLPERYGPQAASVFDAEERRRFYGPDGRPTDPERLNWELLYRLEPALYERLIAGEHIHPGAVQWLPEQSGRALELGAGGGRLTMQLASRCGELIATDPALPLMSVLHRKLSAAGVCNVQCARAFFDSVPVATSTCDLVISCSAFSARSERDPEGCLREMERCCVPGGMIVVIWPEDVGWLEHRGFTRVTFDGDLAVEFGTMREALELTRIFYPDALDAVRRGGSATVPYDVLGMLPPRELCWRTAE